MLAEAERMAGRGGTRSIASGDEVQVRLVSADPVRGELRFERVR